MRLDYALAGYWLARRRDLSENTINDYRRTLDRFVAFLGAEVEIETVSAVDVHRFLNHCRRELGHGQKTLSNAWIALSAFYSWAEIELGIPHVVRLQVPRPRWTRQQVEPFTEDEIRRLMAACRQSNAWTTQGGRRVRNRRGTAIRDRAILLVLLDTGIRVSELVALDVDDYTMETGQLLIRNGKGDKRRAVFVGQTGQNAIWRWLSERPSTPSRALFVSRHSARRLGRRAILFLINRAGERAGVHAYPHKFRHTFAITFLRNGGNPLELQRLLGHSEMKTVNLYASLAAVDLRRAMAAASPADNWGL